MGNKRRAIVATLHLTMVPTNRYPTHHPPPPTPLQVGGHPFSSLPSLPLDWSLLAPCVLRAPHPGLARLLALRPALGPEHRHLPEEEVRGNIQLREALASRIAHSRMCKL